MRLWERWRACQAIRTVAGRALTALLLVGALGCGHFTAVGRGGAVYAIAVDTVNGRKTADRGPVSYPACAIQVGNRMARVWLADETRGDVRSPTILEGDAAALRAGILVERTWSQAVVHKVTDEELAAGAAVVYVPGVPQPTIVELRFERIAPGSAFRHDRDGARSRGPRREARAGEPSSGPVRGPLR